MMMHCVGPKGNFHCVIQNGIVLACEIISHHLCHLFVRQIWYLLYLEQEVEEDTNHSISIWFAFCHKQVQ